MSIDRLRNAAAVGPGQRSSAERTPQLWDRLAAADAIIFGSPTYMGSLSAGFKAFAEASSKEAFATKLWRDKIAAGFTTSSTPSGDKLNVLVDLALFAAQQRMIWIGMGDDSDDAVNRLGVWLGAAAHVTNDAPEVSFHDADLAGARHLGARVAAAARQLERASVATLVAP